MFKKKKTKKMPNFQTPSIYCDTAVPKSNCRPALPTYDQDAHYNKQQYSDSHSFFFFLSFLFPAVVLN